MTRTRFAALALLATLGAVPLHAADPAPGSAVDAAAPAALSAVERKTLIDAAAKALAESYVFPEKVAAIIARLRAADKAGRYAALEPKALAAAMTADMHGVVTDAHLQIHYSPELLPPEHEGQPPTASELARRDAFFRSINYGFREVEVMDGNIGYLLIDGFPDVGGAAPVAESAMAMLGNANALIIDLRGNHGGEPETVALVASYLLPANTHVNDIYYRKGALTQQYWTSGIADQRRIRADVPIYVLTDKKTASGGEELAYDLQQLKRATLVGESTWGGANPGGAARLGDHFLAFIPNGRAINPISKTNWEGSGVQPDVAVAGDQALAKAIELIKAKTAAKASGTN